MKKLLISLFILFYFTSNYSQVGINIEKPLGIFHVDGNKNTVDSTNISDDVIVDGNGNFGIGIMPDSSVKLSLFDGGSVVDVKPVFQLQDGNEGVNKVLVSDADGYATWKESTNFGLTIGKYGGGVFVSADPTYTSTYPSVTARTNNIFVKTTGQITLGTGRWIVRFSMLFDVNANSIDGIQVYARTTLADDVSIKRTDDAANQRSDDVNSQNGFASSMIWCNGYGGVLNGTFTVENTSGSDKTYYLVVGNFNRYAVGTIAAEQIKTVYQCGSSANGENSLFAYRLN